MKWVILTAALLPLAAAQTPAQTCETLLEGVEATAAAASEVVRTMTMRLGEREVAKSVSRVTQDERGVTVTILEQTGQAPPQGAPPQGAEGAPDVDSSLLGVPGTLSCEGAELTETPDGYRLVLTEADAETPIESVELTVQRDRERFVPLRYVAQGTVRQFIFSSAIALSVRYDRWRFE